MNFEQIKDHLTNEGCTFENAFKGVFLVKNCINGKSCYIEVLEFYTSVILSNYYDELGVKPPESIIDLIHIYRTFKRGL